MSRFKFASALGALVLISACTQQDATPPAPAPADAAASAAAPAATPASSMAAPAGMTALTAAQLAETRTNTLGSCNVEVVDGQPFAGDTVKATRKPVVVGGWFMPEQTKQTGSPASIRVANAAGTEGWEGPISQWMPRPDVNAALGSSDTGNAGFNYNLDLSNAVPGTYSVWVTYDVGGDKFECKHPKTIVVE
jgi:hypothetical protein